MAQDTWALKLEPELKEKIQDIVKSNFESSKDFMEQVVNLYELNQLKQGSNIFTPEVEELEALTRRINTIFVNANGKISTMLQDKDTKAEHQTELKQKLIEKLQNDLAKTDQEKLEISTINDTLVNLNNEIKDEVNQLNQVNQTLNSLVTEYKEKNDTLTSLLSEYKEDRIQNKQLELENKELSNSLQQSLSVKENKEREILELKNQLKENSDKNQTKLQEIHDKHSDALTTLQRTLEIDKNMYVLELQQEHQSKFQEIQNKHIAEIEMYQNKYKELLDELQSSKMKSKSKQAPLVVDPHKNL